MPAAKFQSSLVFLPALVAFMASASAQEIRVVSMEIGDNLQTVDSPGLYGEMISHVLKNAGVDYEFRVYPFKRALREFFRGDADCMWALDSRMLRQFGKKDERLLDSEALFTSTQHVFMPPGTHAISSLNDLDGKRVGLHFHSNLLEAMERTSANLVKVNDETTKITMLINNRVDAIIAWIPDALVAFHDEGVDPAWINPVLKIDEADVGITCHENDVTRAFLSRTDAAITEFARSPAYSDILGKYGAIQPKRPTE